MQKGEIITVNLSQGEFYSLTAFILKSRDNMLAFKHITNGLSNIEALFIQF